MAAEEGALQGAPGGPRSTGVATTGPGQGQTARLGSPGGQNPAPAPPVLPPIPPERLLAALDRARSSLVTRQAQLAHCRACGAEAAAYEQAAADVATLREWLRQLAPG